MPLHPFLLPAKTTHSARSDDSEVLCQVSVASTPTSNDSPDINRELNTYKDRLALELNNLKKNNWKYRAKYIEVQVCEVEFEIRI